MEGHSFSSWYPLSSPLNEIPLPPLEDSNSIHSPPKLLFLWLSFKKSLHMSDILFCGCCCVLRIATMTIASIPKNQKLIPHNGKLWHESVRILNCSTRHPSGFWRDNTWKLLYGHEGDKSAAWYHISEWGLLASSTLFWIELSKKRVFKKDLCQLLKELSLTSIHLW